MKRKTLALLLAAALTVTSVEGTATMVSAADFSSEITVQEDAIQESDAEVFSADFTDEAESMADSDVEEAPAEFGDESEEIEITDGETQEEEATEEEINIFDESDDGADEEETETTDNEEEVFTDEENAEADIEVFAGEDETAPTLSGMEVTSTEISLYEAYESEEGYGLVDLLKVNYSDDTTGETFTVYLGDTEVRDKDWNVLDGVTAKLVYADADKAEESVAWAGEEYRHLPPGSYKYIFTWTPEDETKEPVVAETRINVIAFADVYDQLPKLKEGTQRIVTDDTTYFSFEPQDSGTYKFNAYEFFNYSISEITDGKLSEDSKQIYGYETSAEFEGGKKYVIAIFNPTDPEGEYLTIARIPVVKSVEIASWSPENLTFTEGDDVSFYSLDVRLNTDRGSETVRIYGYNGLFGKTTDAYGNTVGYALFKIEDSEFVGLDFTNEDPLPAGEYAFRVYYNNGNQTPGEDPDFIAENYVPVHVKSREEQTKDNVLDTDRELTVRLENLRAVYSFTPKETGRYELSASAFTESTLKDSDGNVIEEQRRHERSMYVSLKADTTYYMYMKVQSYLCTQLKVSARKLALPVEITASLKKTSYAAELTQLWEVQPKFTIKYDDGTSEIATEDSGVSGWGLNYHLENTQGDEIYDNTACIPAGKWMCVPELYVSDEEKETLKDVLKVSTYGTEITAESQKIDVDTLNAITVDNPLTVPETNRTFYRVVAEAGQNYKLETPDGVTAKLYEWDEQDGLKNIDAGYYSVYFETGKIYLFGITAYRASVITLKQTSGGIPVQQYFEETYPLTDGFHETIQMPEGKVSPATLQFTFTPKEDAPYCFQIESNLETGMQLYEEEGDNKNVVYSEWTNGNLKASCYLKKGKTYTYRMVYSDMEPFDKVTVSFDKGGEYRKIKDMTCSLKQGMKATDLDVLTDFSTIYDVQVHYTDDSVYNWDGYTGTDDYGNLLYVETNMGFQNVEAAETTCDVELGYRNAGDEEWMSSRITVPMCGLAGLQSLKTGDSVYPFRNQKIYQTYIFTAEESGLYLWKAKNEKGELSPEVQVYAYEINPHGGTMPFYIRSLVMNELEDNSYTVWLEKGENYLVGIESGGVEYNRNTSLSVKKAKILQSVEIKKRPNQTTLYHIESFSDVSLEGMVITAHYTDGTSEDILYGQTDSNGTLFEMSTDIDSSDEGYWISGSKFRQYLHFGDYSFYVDFDAAEIPEEVPVLKVNTKTDTYVEGKTLVPVRFIPEENGFYSVEMSNGGLSTAVDEETGERWVDTTYYFEKGRSYLIYVQADQKDAYVIIRRGACQWETVTKTDPTCTEDAQYVMKCEIHDHTYSYSSYYEEKDKAYGHAYSTWKVTEEPTCASEGSEERICGRCKNVEKRTVAATGKHSYGSWKITKESTVLNMGQKERICNDCKKKETASVAKLKATISLNVSGTIPLKTKQTFTAKVTMGKGDKVVSWKSSNKKVVSVDKNGKVKGLKAGKTATITVQLQSGLKKSFKVKVQKANVATKSLKVTNASTGKKVPQKVTMKGKEVLKLAVIVSPVTSKEKVKYSSSNKKVAGVSSKGVITAKKKGSATITVKSGKKTYKIKVTVR